MNAQFELLADMAAHGIVPVDGVINGDGALVRFTKKGDRARTRNCWCVAHFDQHAVAEYGDWKTGFRRTWRSQSTPISAELAASMRLEIKIASARRQAERQKSRDTAARVAVQIYGRGSPAETHGYLNRKGVPMTPGLRVLDGRNPWGTTSSLLVPLHRDDELLSLQFVSPDGTKRFLPGGARRGTWYQIGQVVAGEKIAIAEGLATSISVHRSTGFATFCALDTANLLPVGELLAAKYPDCELVFMADHDIATAGNPGYQYARRAAEALGARLVLPDAIGNRNTDFNDAETALGSAAVRAKILSQLGAIHD
jgi:putative DNA primase/helicase